MKNTELSKISKKEILAVSDTLLNTIIESNKELTETVNKLLKLTETQDVYIACIEEDKSDKETILWTFMVADKEDPKKDIVYRVDYKFIKSLTEHSIINKILTSQLRLMICNLIEKETE